MPAAIARRGVVRSFQIEPIEFGVEPVEDGDQVLDHRGQAARRLADVLDLVVRRLLVQIRRGQQLVQNLRAAEDHAQRIFQIMRDGSEHLALESVGALQSLTLVLQPLLRGEKLLRAPRHFFLQPLVGALRDDMHHSAVFGREVDRLQRADQHGGGAGGEWGEWGNFDV